ncbi:MAG TPA: rRNA maturation RNase YbeY [Acidimicrobiales bacterium]|nr:rRNA maturation RNase YbeY [Acidimicrobiales bacterium]
MGVEVFVADEQSQQPVDVRRWSALAERLLVDRGLGADVEVNVLFVDEAAISSLNERFLSREGPTDVLSFPIEDDLTLPIGPPGMISPPGSGPGRRLEDYEDESPGPGIPLLLGDVVICPEVAARNAPEHTGSYDDELALLLVHGILHLLGMDHEDEEEAVAMEALEQELLGRHYRETPS